MSTLSTIFDYLDRPGQMIRGGIKGGYDDNESVLGGAWKGLSGQKKVYGTDLLRDAGMTDPGWGRSALGFGLDIATDPLSFIPAGGVSKLARATGATALTKGVGRLAKSGADKMAPGLVDAVGEGLGKTFVKGYGQPEAFRSMRRVYDAGVRALPREVAEKVVTHVDEADPAVRRAALIWNEMGGQRALPEVQALGGRVKALTQDIFKREADEGLQDITKEIPNYTIRSFKRGQKRDAFAGLGRNVNAKLGFAKKRELGTILDALKAGAEPDVAKALYDRLHAGEKAIRSAQFLKEVSGTFGVGAKRIVKNGVVGGIDKKSIPAGFKAIFSAAEKNALADWGFFQQTIKLADGTVAKLSDVALPEKIADDLHRTFLRGSKDRGPLMEMGKEALGTVNKWFRAGATYLRPGFHMTNLPGNIWNMGLSGMNPVSALTGTAKQAVGLWKGKSAIPAKVGQYSRDAIEDAIHKFGISDPQSTFAGMFNDGDMGEKILQQLGGIDEGNIIKRAAKGYDRGMRKLGTSIEGGSKEALFLRELGKGKTLEEAAGVVNKHLFDYSDLTDKEKFVRNLLPFYTWSRKNIPLQAAELWRDPKRFAAIGKMKHAIEGVTGKDRVAEGDRPEYLRGDEAIQLPWQKAGGATYYDPYLPYKDLNKLGGLNPFNLPTLLKDEGLSMLGPLAKVPLEYLTNRDFLRGTDLYDKDLGYGQMKGTSWAGGTPLPVWLQHWVSSAQPAIPALGKVMSGAATLPGDPAAGISQLLGPLAGIRTTVKDRAGVKRDKTFNRTKAKTAAGRAKKEAKDINTFWGSKESPMARAQRLLAEMQ